MDSNNKNDLQKVTEFNRSNKVYLPDGSQMPRLGQGTWHMGEKPLLRADEIKSLRIGIKLGMTLIDTAEMYGDGRAESLVGEAIGNVPRKGLFLVSKVYPFNAGRPNIFESCRDSLKRLNTDYLDMYLLHWRGKVPLEETVSCMEELVSRGWIRHWGVSNFDTDDMKKLWDIPMGNRCAVNQVLYHIGSRGIEYDLLPWMQDRHIPLMAYCPIAQGGSLRDGILKNTVLNKIAERKNATPAQIMLSFDMRIKGTVVIPKAGTPKHSVENACAGLIHLSDNEIVTLSNEFPAPGEKQPLDMN